MKNMKSIKKHLSYLLLFLITSISFAQNPSRFSYGVQITGGIPTETNPTWLCTVGTTGVLGQSDASLWAKKSYVDNADALKADKTNGATQITDPNAYSNLGTLANAFQSVINTAINLKIGLKEDSSNKINSQAYDGTGLKFYTADVLNEALRKNALVFGHTGIANKNDQFELTVLDANTMRIKQVDMAFFRNQLITPGNILADGVKTFAQKDYPLSQLITATGGNININPLTTDGLYVRYVGYNKDGNVVSSSVDFATNDDIAQLGFVTVIKTGSTVAFLTTTPGARNVFSQPILAGENDLQRTGTPIKSSVKVSLNAAASISTSSGSMTGISINWRGVSNPSNTSSIDEYPVSAQAVAAFNSIDPSFSTSTTPPTAHTLWTELEGGIAINNSFWNTTTSARGTMANGSASVKRVLIGVRGGIFIQEGQHTSTACYSNLAAAKNAIFSQQFDNAIVPPSVAVEIARIAYIKGATNLLDDTQGYIVLTGGGNGAGSGSVAPISDATTVSKGIIQLAGDLAGTATAPTVPGLATKAPISGSANYIQNQNASAQSANMWISGSGNFGDFINIRGSAPYLNLKPTAWSDVYIQAGVNLAGSGAGEYTVFSNPLGKNFAFQRGGATDFVIDSIGNGIFGANVGIGTISPYGKLNVKGVSSNTTDDFITGSTGTVLYYGLGSSTGNTFGKIQVGQNGDNGTFGNLVLQELGGNVGIGATDPLSKFEVRDASSTVTIRSTTTLNTARPKLQFYHDGNNTFDITGGDGLRFLGGASVELMRIANNGNVGIGTNNPASLLNIYGSGTPTFSLSNSDTTSDGSHNVSIGAYKAGFGYNNLLLDAATYQFKIAGTERMRIASSGNALIGTTTDNGVDKLQVNGRISTSGTFGGFWANSSNVNNDNTSFTVTNNSASKIYSFTVGQQGVSQDGFGLWNRTNNSYPVWATENDRVMMGYLNSTLDNGIDRLQVNGTVSGSPATLSNQFVTKAQFDLKADLASPALTGTPTAPTATAGTNTTQIATTAFVANAVSSGTYTPTITGVVNITGFAPASSTTFSYTVNGNIVSVSGTLSVNPTSANTVTQINITVPPSYPISSGGSKAYGVGTFGSNNVTNINPCIIQNSSTTELGIIFRPLGVSGGNSPLTFTATYNL